MELVDPEKNFTDAQNLRLVSDKKELGQVPALERQFVNFIFFRVNSEWRKLDPQNKLLFKKEFISVCEDFRSDLLFFSYSLVGFDSKADLMFWRIGDSLDTIQDMTARIYRSNLGGYLETVDNYLSMTKRMMFVPGAEKDSENDRYHVIAGEKKYLFVYPCSKHPDWYTKTADERESLIEENFMVGQKFRTIKIHMTHAFGFSDQEFVVSFETDEPKDFLALAEELSQTQASKLTLRGTPIYTCRQRTLEECLDSIG